MPNRNEQHDPEKYTPEALHMFRTSRGRFDLVEIRTGYVNPDGLLRVHNERTDLEQNVKPDRLAGPCSPADVKAWRLAHTPQVYRVRKRSHVGIDESFEIAGSDLEILAALGGQAGATTYDMREHVEEKIAGVAREAVNKFLDREIHLAQSELRSSLHGKNHAKRDEPAVCSRCGGPSNIVAEICEVCIAELLGSDPAQAAASK